MHDKSIAWLIAIEIACSCAYSHSVSGAESNTAIGFPEEGADDQLPRRLSVLIPLELDRSLVAAAKRDGLTQAEFVTKALQEGVAREQEIIKSLEIEDLGMGIQRISTRP